MSAQAQKPGWLVSLIVLIAFLALSFGASALGGMFTAASVGDWYQGLHKSELTPPPAVFPIAWTILYAFMGLAAWFTWRAAGGIFMAPGAFLLWLIQLGLNVTWSWLFFAQKNPPLALAEIVILFLAIFFTMRAFWKHSTIAGLLFLPYLIWVGFAAYLNLAVVMLNPF